MKKKLTLIGTVLLIITTLLKPHLLLAQAGSLDLSFGISGKVKTSVSLENDEAKSVAIQSDGKIVVAGTVRSLFSFGNDFSVVRYNPNGSLDSTFDMDGKVITEVTGLSENVHSVAVQSDGKIVVVGSSELNNYLLTVVVVRYNSNGSLDSTFNANGIVFTAITNSSQASAEPFGLALQADGKIVVCGTKYDGQEELFVVRYNLNGSLDSSFDTDGIVKANSGFVTSGHSVAIQNDGKILIAGVSYVLNEDFHVIRLNNNGSLDNTFDNDGKVYTDIFGNGISSDYGLSIALQNDGKILVGGKVFLIPSWISAIVRYNTDGSLDSTFDSDGILVTSDINLKSMVIQNDNKIIAAGETPMDATTQSILVARYNSNGSIDSTFDNDGIQTTNMNLASYDWGNAVAIQNNGKIIVAGATTDGSNGAASWDFALVRYNNDFSIPLPTELQSFEALCQNGVVNLKWSTNSPLHSSYFTIDRSTNGVNYETIDTINITTFGNQTEYYSAYDRNAFQGTSYYRLAKTDIDGKLTSYAVIQVNCNDFTEPIIYPNPNVGSFSIKGIWQNSEISIHDIMGKTIYHDTCLGPNRPIDLTGQVNGIYFVMIRKNGNVLTRKFLINR